MTDDTTQAYADAEAAASPSLAELVDQVTDKLGLHAGARAVFGEPVERHGVTVIPVAQMAIGAGASGRMPATAESGSGAGGGAATRPIGYIEIGPHGAAFRPLQRAWQNATLVVSAAFAVLLLAKAVRTLLRG